MPFSEKELKQRKPFFKEGVFFLKRAVWVIWVIALSCSSDDSDEPTRLDTFNPNVLNNIIQDPGNASQDNYYPEFTLNLEEASVEDRDGVISVIANWPDGRSTSLEKDFRPEDGILRWVKHDLDRFGTLAPGGNYTFEVSLASGEVLTPVEVFDQHLLGRPTQISIVRNGNNLDVGWTAPDRDHLWSVQVLVPDPGSSEVVVEGPATGVQASANERVSYQFTEVTLSSGPYRLAIIMSDDSNLRSLKVDFEW